MIIKRRRQAPTYKEKILAAAIAFFLIGTIGVARFEAALDLPMEIEGVSEAGANPSICIGFNNEENRWGDNWGMCPANHALYGVDDPGGVQGPPEKIRASMACCQLPKKDILTEEHVFATEKCPDGYVATGSLASGKPESRNYFMRCTRINEERYQLGEPTAGLYWGHGHAGWRNSQRIGWENIPAAMRYAHGRTGPNNWSVDGCVGYPWGSLLTTKKRKHCGTFRFQQLQYTGVDGQPDKGTPVKMMPDCDDIGDVNDPSKAFCLKSNG